MRRLALATILLSLTACATLGQLAGQLVERPRLTFVAATVTALDLDGADLALDFKLENPNDLGAALARADFQVAVDGVVVARGALPGGLQVPARGAAPVRLAARIRFAEVPRLVERLAAEDHLAYTVGGTLGVDTPAGVIELPVQASGTLPLPRRPGVALAGASFRLVSFGEVDLILELVVTNPNRFPLPAGQARLEVAVGGERVAEAAVHTVAALAAGAAGRSEVPIRISLAGAGRAAAQLVRGQATDVTVRGETSWGALRAPLDLGGRATPRP